MYTVAFLAVVAIAVVAIVIAIVAMVPRSITLELESNGFHPDVVILEIAKWLPNGYFDHGRIPPRYVDFDGSSKTVKFNGLAPGQWYEITLSSKICASRVMLKTGSFIRHQLHDKCSEDQIAQGAENKMTAEEMKKMSS